MNITINGDVYITNYGQTLDELVGEDVNIPFDDFNDDDEDCDDDCDGNCYDCEYGDEDDDDEDDEEDDKIEFDLMEDERFEDYPERYIELLSDFVKSTYDTDFCPYCLASLFDDFLEIYLEGR